MQNKDNEPKKKKISKAYDNTEFLHSKDGRVIRLLAEYLYPKRQFELQKINKGITIFGSARINSEENLNNSIKKFEILLSNEKNKSKQKNLELKIIENKNLLKSTHYYDEARQLAKLISSWSKKLSGKSKFNICTGGGPGIMEAANRGAADAGAKSIGLNISLPFEQHPNPYIDEDLNFEFHYFFMRKYWFVSMAAAIIVFPGGFGTLDELMEVMTLRQTQKVTKPLPIILYSRNFWEKLINFELMKEIGVISSEDLNLFKFADSPDEAFSIIKNELSNIYKLNK